MSNKDTEKNTENVSENTQNVIEEQVDFDSDLDIELEETEYEGVGLKDKLQKMRLELAEAKSSAQEYLTGWQKERADFANFKAEEEKKRKDRIDALKLNLISDFFPVLDSFDMAFSNQEAWEKVDPAWRTGVEYIYTQFMNTLESYNISFIDQVGIGFDPMIHDPSETVSVESQDQDNKIHKIIQKGYRSGETILRPAKVHVTKYEN